MDLRRKFARFAVFVLLYNLVVILWGAFVRLSFSGDGCGSHWPLCNGEILPSLADAKTAIEFAHRVSSGLVLPLTIALILVSVRWLGKSHPSTRWSVAALFFTVVSALIGMLLVRNEWVGTDASSARAITLGFHLINTMLLIGSLVAAIWWAGREPAPLLGSRLTRWLAGLGTLGILLVGMSGAITSLGDTIFPRDSSLQVIQEALTPTGHFLLRMRLWHPFIAVAVALLLLGIVLALSETSRSRAVRSRGGWVLFLVALQIGVGVVSVWLKAPTLLALLHLLLADLLWIAALLLWFDALASLTAEVSP